MMTTILNLFYCESLSLNTDPTSTLRWRGMTEESFSLVCHITQTVRQSSNDSFTPWMLFPISRTFFLFPLTFLDEMLDMVFSVGSALLRLNISMLVNLQYSPCLSLKVSLYTCFFVLFFALMWFCVFLRSKKVVWIEEFFSSNNAEIVTILWLLSIHYCVVQGDSASCLSLSQRPKQNPGNFNY